MAAQALLVLHGITMSGSSMLRTLGPLGPELDRAGFELLAPDAGHRMTTAEVDAISGWMSGFYEKLGLNMHDEFCDGRLWDGDRHYDWFDSKTAKETGRKTYRAVERSLDGIAAAIQGKRAVGVLGFSQGSAMAYVLCARALAGDSRFADLNFAAFVSGFRPVFDEPRLVTYPISGRLRTLFVIGQKDPVFPGTEEYLSSMAGGFAEAERELLVVPELGHDIPRDSGSIQRIVRFATAGAGR